VTFVNPEPLAPFADVIAAGEGESLVPALRAAIGEASGRDDLLARLAVERGFYVPKFYEPHYAADGSLAGYAVTAGVTAPVPVRKAALRTTEAVDPPATSIFTPDTEFGSRFLVEVVRGCANLCRFCWAGYNYLPVRAFPTERILELAAAARTHANRVGLVSIALCDHPDIERILERMKEMGYAISPASLRPRRSDADDRPAPARERRAIDHDRAGNRIRSAAPRDQQDGDQRRDPGPRRAHFRERHREPEALLHDRPPDRD
jgi:radical SAM superfamily enzyme YgiQ (UPF0313 family)